MPKRGAATATRPATAPTLSPGAQPAGALSPGRYHCYIARLNDDRFIGRFALLTSTSYPVGDGGESQYSYDGRSQVITWLSGDAFDRNWNGVYYPNGVGAHQVETLVRRPKDDLRRPEDAVAESNAWPRCYKPAGL